MFVCLLPANAILVLLVQAEAQVQEQLFKLYHNEAEIERLTEELRVRQKDLDRLVRSGTAIKSAYTYVCNVCM